MKFNNLLEMRQAIPAGTKLKSKISEVIKIGEVTGYFEGKNGKGFLCKIIEGETRFIGKEEKLYLSEVEIV